MHYFNTVARTTEVTIVRILGNNCPAVVVLTKCVGIKLSNTKMLGLKVLQDLPQSSKLKPKLKIRDDNFLNTPIETNVVVLSEIDISKYRFNGTKYYGTM